MDVRAPSLARRASNPGAETVLLQPTADAPLAFRVRALTKVYRVGAVDVQALRGVDLDVPAGEMVVFLGPSGSGKSTLLNILGGLDHPSGGLVSFYGEELTAADDRALTRYRRDHVGFVLPVLQSDPQPYGA